MSHIRSLQPHLLHALPVFLITIVIFVLTKNPLTAPLKLQMMILSLIVLLIYGYLIKRNAEKITDKRTFLYLVTIFVLFLVGATGWFFSPFFFTLYLLIILIAFTFTLPIALGFVLTLVALFSFNIGEVDLAYDYLVVFSLLTTIPLSSYLRKEYLKLKEAEKEILVLEQHQQEYKSKVEEILANTVNKFAVDIRQPINDIKQMAYYLEHAKDKKTIDKYRDRIIASSEDAINQLNSFEAEVTGRKLLSSSEVS